MSQKRWVHIYRPSTDKADTGLQVTDHPGLWSKILHRRARTNPGLAQEKEEKCKKEGRERGRRERRVGRRQEGKEEGREGVNEEKKTMRSIMYLKFNNEQSTARY